MSTEFFAAINIPVVSTMTPLPALLPIRISHARAIQLPAKIQLLRR